MPSRAEDHAGRHPDALGIGVGHPEATTDCSHPYRNLVEYLDVLDAAGVPTACRNTGTPRRRP